MIRQPLTVANALYGGQQSLLPETAFDTTGATPPIYGGPDVSEPFVWGAGGSKLTPDQLAAKQAIAAQLMQSDYSPVGSVWEGLGRVVDNVSGAFQQRNIDKQSKGQATAREQIAQAIIGGDQDAISAGVNSGDPALQKLALQGYELAHPKPVNNDTAMDAALYDERLGAGAGNRYLESKLDPIVQLPTPFGPYVGPKSQFAPTMARLQGGGGPVSTGTGGTPPATLPPDFDFGGPTQPASGTFR